MASIIQQEIPRPQTFCERTKERISNSCIGRNYRRINPYFPWISEGVNTVANIVNARILQSLFSAIFDTTTATGNRWADYAGLWEMVKISKLGSVVAIPFALYGFGWEMKELIKGSNSRIDSTFRALENLSWFGVSSAAFIRGLHMAGKVGQKALPIAFHFAVVGGVLSTGSLCLHLRRYYQGKKLLKVFKAHEANANQMLQKLHERSSYELNYQFNADGDKLRTQLEAFQGTTPETQIKAVSLLKRRLEHKNLSDEMAILAAIVTLVASAIFLKDSSSSLAYGLLGGGAIISLARFCWEIRSVRKFNKKILLLLEQDVT